jgi:hypothetical protein
MSHVGKGNRGKAKGERKAYLVLARQSLLVILTIDSDVLKVSSFELLDGVLDVLHASLFTHRLLEPNRKVGDDQQLILRTTESEDRTLVEKLVWQPAPFHSPSATILGWN